MQNQTTDNQTEYNKQREAFIEAENIIQFFLQNIYTVNGSLKTITRKRIDYMSKMITTVNEKCTVSLDQKPSIPRP